MEYSNKLNGEVLHIVSDERAINFLWEKDARKISPHVQILPISTALSKKGMFDGNVLLDSIWIKHPFIRNKYIDINSSEDIIIKMKLDAIGIIAKHLGVKEYETCYASEIIQERERTGESGFKYKIINSDTSIKINRDDTRTAKYHRLEKYSGEFTEDSYLQAKAKAKEFGLDKDTDIWYLIENRNPKDTNILKVKEVTTELTEELNKSIDIAFSLGIGIFNIAASYKDTLKNRKTVKITSRLVF